MDSFKSQARYFANIPIIKRQYIASVHIENKNDKMFCDAILQRNHPGSYYFISESKNENGNKTEGCAQCLKYQKWLSSRFFIFIDSDMRYLMQEKGIDAMHYICQTYTYSWENHYCEAHQLQQRFTDVTTVVVKNIEFDFTKFLTQLSNIVFKPLALYSYCKRNNLGSFRMKDFTSCIPGQIQADSLNDNGNVLLNDIEQRFARVLNKPEYSGINLDDEINKLGSLGVSKENAYLHIRGHNLYNLVCHIGEFLVYGKHIDFEKDVLCQALPQSDYWELQRINDDIKAIFES